jgi:acyl dehydratase
MTSIAPHRLRACNTAKLSENKIHDDAVARRFGFTGGLVPGVDVYAYMTNPPVARWGRAWLERGRMECRFSKPVYDGDDVEVAPEAMNDGLALAVYSRGETCANGTAALTAAPSPAGVFAEPPAPPETRPEANETSLAAGTLLGMRPLMLTPDYVRQYLADVGETDPLYARESLAHPAIVLRTCNWALGHNVVLGPWIHVGSTVQHLGLARVGDELAVRARVAANYERKGHRFVDLDALVLAGGQPVARITHIAIYRPRQVAEQAATRTAE